MLNALRQHWPKLAVLVALCLAFAVGRYSVAPRVEVREVEKLVERVVEQRVEVAVRAAAEVRRVVVYRDRLVQPDGTVREREVETTDSKTVERELRAAAETRVEVREVEKLVERVVEHRPAWRATALAGVDVRQVSLAPPAAGPVVFGAALEHSVVGPVSAGVWGLSNGTGGLSVSIAF